jgi:hypothetical protein
VVWGRGGGYGEIVGSISAASTAAGGVLKLEFLPCTTIDQTAGLNMPTPVALLFSVTMHASYMMPTTSFRKKNVKRTKHFDSVDT